MATRSKSEPTPQAESSGLPKRTPSWADMAEDSDSDIDEYVAPGLPPKPMASAQPFDPELDCSRDGINLFMTNALRTNGAAAAPAAAAAAAAVITEEGEGDDEEDGEEPGSPDLINRKRSKNFVKAKQGDAKRARPADGATPSKEPWEVEDDPKRLEWRAKQVAMGKQSEGYANYISQVPIEKRKKHKHPVTPDIHRKCSKRQFAGLVNKWRRDLHDYDPAGTVLETQDDTAFPSLDDAATASPAATDAPKGAWGKAAAPAKSAAPLSWAAKAAAAGAGGANVTDGLIE